MVREKGFTLAEILIVVLIIAILSSVAVVFFTGRTDGARDAVAEANLRAALVAVRVEYLQEGKSLIKGPLATGASDQEKAENFIQGSIQKNSNLEAILSSTPEQGQIGVQVNSQGTSGTLYAQQDSGYLERALP